MISGVLAVVFVFSALMLGGFTGAWAIWPTAYRHGYAEGEQDRHRHRAGQRQETTLLELPRAGRLPLERLADPAPLPGEWRFAGGWDQGPVADTAEQPEVVAGVDTPSDYTRGMTERVNAMIAEWAAQGNYDRHTMKDAG